MPVLKPEALVENRVNALREYHKEAGTPRAELDLSGGIDSAVMACLLIKALGPENVTLVHTIIGTDPKATQRANDLAAALKCPLIVGDFDRIFKDIVRQMDISLIEAGYNVVEIRRRCVADPTIAGSLRSTLRAPLGRAYNRLTGGGIRHGTGNECEDRFLRFYQKGGDGEVDTNPIEMLSKTEVYQLAFALGQDMGPKVAKALRPIIEVAPSPDLWGIGEGNHKDEDELFKLTGAPFTYGRINSDTGEIVRVGNIERVSRFLDGEGEYPDTGHVYSIEAVVFADTDAWWASHEPLVDAKESGCFNGLDDATILSLLLAARKCERASRHKSNTNIPTLGTRASLVDAGILTNELP